MPCEELNSCLVPVATPTGCLDADAAPRAGDVCRSFDFGGAQFIVTLVDNLPIYTFGEKPIQALA